MLRMLAVLLMSLIIISGCSSENDEVEGDLEGQQEEEEEVVADPETEESANDLETNGKLSLQVLKMDEEAGVTIENSDIYSGLESIIAKDPTIGASDDFTVRTIDIYNTEDGAMLILLGINRLGTSIKNVSFELTLGNDSGDYVWEEDPVMLSQDKTGVIEHNSAIPILRNLSEEEVELLKTMDESNIEILVENFDFEKEE